MGCITPGKTIGVNYSNPQLAPSKLTWQWNMSIFNREYIFNPGPFSIAMLVYQRVGLNSTHDPQKSPFFFFFGPTLLPCRALSFRRSGRSCVVGCPSARRPFGVPTPRMPCSWQRTGVFIYTLQEINISHLGKRKIIFKYALSGGYVNSLEGIICRDFPMISQILKNVIILVVTGILVDGG